ncbi:MAG TPA: hypothetical protein VJ975_08465 [Candidatus Limnocylindria bacterium]|nr:hypothetical protein [Candidatus Limnocylindria bacterium]
MASRRAIVLALAWLALVASALPGSAGPARAADEYTLQSTATYDLRPSEGVIGVTVQLTLTNTTPDPEGQFSVFSEIKVAIHDAATDVTASDTEGDLEVAVAVADGVNVATIQLRDDIRFEEEAGVELSYTLPNTADDPHQRVRSALVVFPAWSFGTSGTVAVTVPAGYEMRVDGDPMTEENGQLVSGPIDDPGQWLSLVTAVKPAEYTQLEATIPLEGGTADLLVRAFTDDEAWGQRTLDLVSAALPLLEEEIGLPYPRIGQIILTESVATDSTGFGEGTGGGNEIQVAYDQPPFTALHQVAHVWLAPSLIESAWIREGLASHVAAHVGEQLDVEPPYDPAAETQARAAAAVKLDTWSSSDGPEAEAYGFAASWDVINQLEAAAGEDSLRAVLTRVASSVGPYELGELEPEPPTEGGGAPTAPLTTRAFLDHLETVSDADVSSIFANLVLTDDDVALLEPRTAARAAFDELAAAADSWGAPDPVRAAMVAWNFEEAQSQIEAAMAWLDERDDLLTRLEEAGLATPDRLRQAYTAYGGGPEAVSELDAERTVVEEYQAAADDVNGERSFIERIGLVGGPDPEAQLSLASGRFGDGDLRGALDAIAEAQRIVGAAETGGFVRLASVVVLALVLVVAAVILFRRRASYTSRA